MRHGKPRPLTRELLRSGVVQRLILEQDPTLVIASPSELSDDRRRILDGADLSRGVWLFAYGSLIWNPAFHFVEHRVGTVSGFHRRFCIWTHVGRGTAGNPGLLLGLDAGGACRGVIYRIAPDAIDSELDILWQREMLTGVYAARWISARIGAEAVRAITFVANRRHERYAGRLPVERVAALIAAAEGPIGRCSDYLANTVTHLEMLGIGAPGLAALCDQVTALQKAHARRSSVESTVPRTS